MRKLVFIAVLCVFVALPVMAGPFGHGAGYDGGTAKWDRKGGYYAGGGGEFTIWGPDLLLSNSAYADSTSGLAWDGKGGPESFQTFCIEMGERIFEPMEVWVSEASTTQLTEYGSGSHAWEGGTGSGDDLDPMTAYLYTKFATGTLLSLNGYSYDYTPGSGRQTSADQLQRAIWAIEGEYTLTGSDSMATAWKSAAQTAVDAGTWVGIGDVRVLQMYKQVSDSDFDLKQDQLYLTPIPGAAILGILGLGVVSLKLRKFA